MVKVQPNANRNEIFRFKEGVLEVRVAAPPIQGKANLELIKFLGPILGVSKGNLTVEKGMTSRKKVIRISGLTQNQVIGQLEELCR